MATLELHPIDANETYKLRHRILRPYQPLSMRAFPYDTAPGAFHAGCFWDGQLIGIGSLLPDPRENASQPTSWRLRGMAVLDEMRGTGAGGKILQRLIDYALTQALPAEIWCNGRSHVRGFYIHFGFEQQGESFDLPGIGPHVLLVKILSAHA